MNEIKLLHKKTNVNDSSRKMSLNQLTILNLFGIEQVLKEDFQSFENCPNLVVKKGATNKLNEVG